MTYVFIKGEYLETGIEGEHHMDMKIAIGRSGREVWDRSCPHGSREQPALPRSQASGFQNCETVCIYLSTAQFVVLFYSSPRKIAHSSTQTLPGNQGRGNIFQLVLWGYPGTPPREESDRLISLMNMDVKILNKI